MQSLNLKTYLLYAVYIVRTHPRILFFVAAVGLLNGLVVYFPEGGVAGIFGSITVLSAIFISPVIYGIYYEIIENSFSSIAAVFRTYVGGYLLLLFCMYIPIIITTSMLMSLAGTGENTAYVMLTILIFSMLFIYVVPAYYVSGKIISSLTYGVGFFFRNVAASAPLLLMALASEMLLLLSHFTLRGLKESSPAIFVLTDFFIYMAASIIDFLLFIMLVYVLRSSNIEKR